MNRSGWNLSHTAQERVEASPFSSDGDCLLVSRLDIWIDDEGETIEKGNVRFTTQRAQRGRQQAGQVCEHLRADQ